MRIERINENKIKVLIDDVEAKERNITIKNICDNTPEVQQMFWQAIRLAKESVDFSIDGAKLFVETIPACESGIGMLITKVSNDSELEEAVNNCSYKGRLRRSELKPMKKEEAIQRKYIYCFETFDSVCAAAGELSDRYRGVSVLYKLNEKFYMYLIPAEPISQCEAEIVLSEFAVRQANGQYMHGRLNEYGTVMIENNAIEVLSEYFCKC